MVDLPPTKLTLVSPRKDQWPRVSDTSAITLDQLRPGRVATVRTRRGFRRIIVRTVRQSAQGRNRGRSFVTGVTPRGTCRTYWADQVIHVATPRRERDAITTPRTKVLALPRGSS